MLKHVTSYSVLLHDNFQIAHEITSIFVCCIYTQILVLLRKVAVQLEKNVVLHILVCTSWSKRNGTGHFCDKKQINQRINVKSKILTIQPIIHVVIKSYHHILKIVDMRAIWKKMVILEKQTLFNKTEMRTLEIKNEHTCFNISRVFMKMR